MKNIQCPYCFLYGFLILHGYLRGYNEITNEYQMIRGRRIFCSNRYNRSGCGRTFSILKANIIKHFTTTALTLWDFIFNIFNNNSILDAFKNVDASLSTTSIYRLYKKFIFNQNHIRTQLLKIKPPPVIPDCTNSVKQTIKHLKDVFFKDKCPITAFQYAFQKGIF